MFRDLKTLILCVCFLLFLSLGAFAQHPDGVMDEKKALILEIKGLTGVSGFKIEQKLDSTDIGNALDPVVEKDKDLTEEQKQELRGPLAEAKGRLVKEIGDFIVDDSVSAPLFEEAFLNLYETNFTLEELKEMAVFYRTPTGQKAAKFANTMTSQLTKIYSEALSKKLREFIDLKLKEQWDIMKQKVNETKKAKSDTKLSA